MNRLRHRTSARHAVLCLALALSPILPACGGGATDNTPTQPSTAVATVAIIASDTRIVLGGSLTLGVELRNAAGTIVSGTVDWSSSNIAVAPVSTTGRVQGLSAGTATITARSGTASSTVSLTVAPLHAIISVSTNPGSPLALELNELKSIVATATLEPGAPQPSISWTSSNPAVVAIDQQGNITATGSGNATVTATATTPANSSFIADTRSATIIVTVAAAKPALSALTLTPSSSSIGVLQQLQLTPNVTKANAGVSTTFSYQSAQSDIASVDNTGRVTSASVGTTTITVTATAPGSIGVFGVSLTAAATVTVVSIPGITALSILPTSYGLAPGTTQLLTPTVQQPAGAPVAVLSYSSSAPGVATVTPNGGVITAVAAGTTNITITATSLAGNGFTATTRSIVAPLVVSRIAVSLLGMTTGDVITAVIDSATAFGNISGLRVSNNPQTDGLVDVTNVRDEIRVRMLLETPLATFDSVLVTMSDVGGNNKAVIGRLTGPLTPGVQTIVANTAQFSLNEATGVATVAVPNGLRLLQLTAWYRTSSGVAASAQSATNQFNVNNLDGVALFLTPPAKSALDGAGRVWFGGSGASGVGSFTAVPVLYTPGRQITSMTLAMGRCPGNVVKLAAPFRATFGGAGTGSNINCSGIIGSTDAADNFRAEDYPMVLSSIDNNGNPGPRVTYVYDPGAGLHTWAGPRPSLWRQSIAFPSPAALRLDYTGIIVP